MACIESHVVRNTSWKAASRNGCAGGMERGHVKFLLVPVLGCFGLGAVLVGYAAVGVLLAVLLLASLTLPLAIAFRRFAPVRYARMQESRPVW